MGVPIGIDIFRDGTQGLPYVVTRKLGSCSRYVGKVQNTGSPLIFVDCRLSKFEAVCYFEHQKIKIISS